MATNPSAIYTSGNANDSSLFYQNPQGQYTKIANTTELQNLAQQGLVQVGGQRQVLPQGAVSTQPTTISSTSPNTAPVAPMSNIQPTTQTQPQTPQVGSLEERPGVYKASSLTDFYQNEINRRRPVFEQAQTTLGDINQKIADLYGGQSMQDVYDQRLKSATSTYDQTISERTNELNNIGLALANIEQDVRQRIGNTAPESYIQSVISREAEPLIRRQQALTQNLSLLNEQRNSAVSNTQQYMGYANQDISNKRNLLNDQFSLAKDTYDTFMNLVDKGVSITEQEKAVARNMFSNFIEKNPSFLGNLSPEESQQLETGNIMASVIEKMGKFAEENTMADYENGIIGEYQFYADQERKLGRTPIGFNEYQTIDANRKAAQTNTVTPSQILNRAGELQKIASEQGQVLSAEQAIAQAQREFAMLSGGSSFGSSSNGGTTQTYSFDQSQNGQGYGQDTASNDLPHFMEALAKQESGGRYNAVGPKTSKGDRAYGKYQIMGANLPSWTKEALGQVLTPQEFLNSPEAQEAVASYKFQQYYSKYGNWQDVASVWFSGRPLSGNTSKDVTGTSVPQYVRNVMSNMGRSVKNGAPNTNTNIFKPNVFNKPVKQNEEVPGTFVPETASDPGKFTPAYYGTKLGQKTLDNESQAQARFLNNQIVKDFNSVMDQVSSAKAIISSGVGGPQDLALVYGFMKALDPGSVVRDTEFDMAAKSGNIFKGWAAKLNGYFKEDGGRLPDDVRNQFIKIMEERLKAKVDQYNKFAKQQRDIAKRQDMNPDNVALTYKYIPEKPSSTTKNNDPLGLGLSSGANSNSDPLGIF